VVEINFSAKTKMEEGSRRSRVASTSAEELFFIAREGVVRQMCTRLILRVCELGPAMVLLREAAARGHEEARWLLRKLGAWKRILTYHVFASRRTPREMAYFARTNTKNHVEWVKKAALKGDAMAQYSCGDYYQGWYEEKALKWLALAATQGERLALEALKVVPATRYNVEYAQSSGRDAVWLDAHLCERLRTLLTLGSSETILSVCEFAIVTTDHVPLRFVLGRMLDGHEDLYGTVLADQDYTRRRYQHIPLLISVYRAAWNACRRAALCTVWCFRRRLGRDVATEIIAKRLLFWRRALDCEVWYLRATNTPTEDTERPSKRHALTQ
jgi:hypothetical protein